MMIVKVVLLEKKYGKVRICEICRCLILEKER